MGCLLRRRAEAPLERCARPEGIYAVATEFCTEVVDCGPYRALVGAAYAEVLLQSLLGPCYLPVTAVSFVVCLPGETFQLSSPFVDAGQVQQLL
jgi:hypothetical protein